ncbi:MAG TPA: alkaline phosphatase PhoX [Burkholderiales bacterium]|nr:alkaline phosphatase PhoX [Burkholderiales bacterium]
MKKSNAIAPAPARRRFLRRSSALIGGAFFGATTLQLLNAHTSWAAATDGEGQRGKSPMAQGYGPLKPTADQNGKFILALPHGFYYQTFGATGSEILGSNGLVHPRAHDGMDAFVGPNGTVRLIRNHEVRNAPDDSSLAVPSPSHLKWDDSLGVGGTLTLDYDLEKRKVVNEFVSLSGSLVNCSGGRAYRDMGWITCEETTLGTVDGNGKPTGWKQKHGYAFLVPTSANATVKAEPILGMGRFSKEAAVADYHTGVVYITEDSGNTSGFYRFTPTNPANLHAGGKLEMLAVKNSPQFDTRANQTRGTALPVEWVAINNPDPGDIITSTNSCFAQGLAKGGARFNRLEGIYRTKHGSFVFVSTSGGDAKYGQLWEYTPNAEGGALKLVFESPDGGTLDSPDNLCVTPKGGILFCEDDASGDGDSHPLAPGIVNVNRLVGLSPSGEPFEFAVNIFSDSEFAGACFSPDGKVLFVNIQGGNTMGSGMTIAIHGPFERGPL